MSKAFLLKQFQKDVGMNQEDYEANLHAWFGKSSSTELTPREVNQALVNIEQTFGWKPTVHANEKQIKRIKYLWLCLKDAKKLENPRGLTSFVDNFTYRKNWYKATHIQLSQCIQALQAWCDREQVNYNKGQRRG